MAHTKKHKEIKIQQQKETACLFIQRFDPSASGGFLCKRPAVCQKEAYIRLCSAALFAFDSFPATSGSLRASCGCPVRMHVQLAVALPPLDLCVSKSARRGSEVRPSTSGQRHLPETQPHCRAQPPKCHATPPITGQISSNNS